MVSRAQSESLIPEEVSNEIIKGAVNKSAAMQLMRIRRMKTGQLRMPIISVLPDDADFLASDTSLKPISEMEWDNKYLDAAPIATIVAFPEDVIDDIMDGGGFDVWDEVRPQIEDDIARKIDNAVFFGVGKPSAWPTAIATAAASAGNTVTAGTSSLDIFGDISDAMALVEADGYEVDGHWARQQFKAVLRNTRDGNDGFLYPASGPANTGAENAGVRGELFGSPLRFSVAGLSGFATAAGKPHIITGAFKQAIFGIRKDLRTKILDQASLHNADGSLRYNLPQQDMVALRIVGRFAWQVPNPINRMQETEANRYPFAVVVQA